MARQLKLKHRMLAIFVPSILVVLSAAMVISTWLTQRSIGKNVQPLAGLASALLADAVASSAGDSAQLRQRLSSVTRNADVSYLSVTDARGAEWFRYRRAGLPSLDAAVIRSRRVPPNETFERVRVAPVGAASYGQGTLTLGVVLKERARSVLYAQLSVVGLGVATLVILGLITLVIATMVTRPLAALGVASKRVAAGDLSVEIGSDRSHEMGDLAQAFRDTTQYVKDVAAAVERLARGDFSTKLLPRSERDLLSKNAVRATATLEALLQETLKLTRAAGEGRLDVRGNDAGFEGGFRDLIHGINHTLEPMHRLITESGAVLREVAAGDLTVRVGGEYKGEHLDVKISLNHALDSLSRALRQVATAAGHVAGASDGIASGSAALAVQTGDQAARLQTVSESLRGLSSASHQNSASAREAKTISDSARTSALAAAESARLLADSMERMKASSDSTARIVKTIDEIAFQTNLLALNAAVEAARAGDSGAGFAVVADEVRNLAMRSAEAAKSTAALIEESVRNASDGAARSLETSRSLAGIQSQVDRVGTMMTEIVAAGEQQHLGIKQINDAVDEMNLLTQDAAASSANGIRTSEELSRQADHLQRLVASFVLPVATTAAPVRVAPRRALTGASR